MARTKLNLNRFRKIYPQLRKSPVFWYKEQNGIPLEVASLSGGGVNYTYTTSRTYNSPIVVATADENVNVWVESLFRNPDGRFNVTVRASDSEYIGTIHIHIGEANA